MEDSDHQYSVAFIGSNDDLLTEILLRLPAASILRFKSVCKHWRLLLTHKHFTHRYVSKSTGLFANADLFPPNDNNYTEPHCLYVPFDVETRSPPPININNSLDFYFNRSHVTIEQSCNGLLLCYTFRNNYDLDREYFVFNPTTKQLALIPSVPTGQRCSKSRYYMALAFHQTHCVNYKVVCIRFIDNYRRLIQVLVYSSDTRKWNICVESFSTDGSEFCHPVYWNGAVHWAPHYGIRNHKNFYFNTDDEQLQMLPLPLDEMMSYERRIMYFGESRDHLHLILCRKPEEHMLIVCEMLMDHSGWFVKYRLQLDELPGAFPEIVYKYGYIFEVADVVRGEEEKDTFLVLSTIEKMIRYNVHDKSFKELYHYNDVKSFKELYHYNEYCCCYEYPSMYRYIETLSSF